MEEDDINLGISFILHFTIMCVSSIARSIVCMSDKMACTCIRVGKWTEITSENS